MKIRRKGGMVRNEESGCRRCAVFIGGSCILYCTNPEPVVGRDAGAEYLDCACSIVQLSVCAGGSGHVVFPDPAVIYDDLSNRAERIFYQADLNNRRSWKCRCNFWRVRRRQ